MRIGAVPLVLLIAACSTALEPESPTTLDTSAVSHTSPDSGASITTDATSYAAGNSITVTWNTLPGSAHDWVALSVAGAADTSVISWVYTAGAASGSHAFAGLPGGAYTARAYVDDSYTIIAHYDFTVTGASLTHDAVAYASSQPIGVTWSGLPGSSTDWVALAPAGSAATTVSAWFYTGGAPSGVHVFAGGLATPGAYVVRAFPNDSYSIAGESSTFPIGASVATDSNSYAVGGVIDVSWSNLTTNAHDWVAIAPSGSSTTTVTAWVYTTGAGSGSHIFATPAAGTYVARAFIDDSYTLLAESAAFAVGGPPPPTGSIAVDRSAYGWGQDITVTWDNFPSNAHDWIALAPAGSASSSTTRWLYTNGQSHGSYVFVDGLPTIGTYVARGFVDDSFTLVVESSAFTIQDACTATITAASTGVSNATNAAANKNLRSTGSLFIAPDSTGLSFSLPCLESVTGDVDLEYGGQFGNYYRLASVSLPRLTSIGGKMTLRDLSSLVTPRLASIGGQLRVLGTRLHDLTAFSHLTSVASLSISGDITPPADGSHLLQVQSIDGLQGLTSIPGSAAITLFGIQDLTGLDHVTTIGGDLTVYSFHTLHGLESLASVAGNVLLSSAAYDGIGSLVSVGGGLRLYPPGDFAVPAWSLGSAFASLATVGGVLTFDNPIDVTFPSLQYSYSLVTNGGYSPAMHSLHAPLLTHVIDQFVIINHPCLPPDQVYQIYNNQLDHTGGNPQRVQLGNFGTCP